MTNPSERTLRDIQIDPRTFFSSEDADRMQTDSHEEFNEFFYALAGEPNEELSPEEFWECIDKAIHQWREKMSALSQRFSSVDWLYYLRRLPSPVYAAGADSTAAENRHWAELCSAMSRIVSCQPAIAPQGLRVVSREDLDYVLRFCLAARRLKDLYTFRRIAGAARVPWMIRQDAAPEPLMNDELRLASAIYSQRVNQYQCGIPGLGLIVNRTNIAQAEHLALAVVRLPQEMAISSPLIDNGTPLLALYNLVPFTFDVVQRFREACPDSSSKLGREVTALIQLLFGAPVLLDRLPHAWKQLAWVGYIRYEEEPRNAMMNVAIDGQKGAENTLGRSLEPTEFYEVLRTLLSKDAELPVLRESDDRIMLDLSSASRLLGEILIDSVPDGQVQDRRGKLLFEPQVQALINESPWTPSNSLLQIRNRKLLLSGTDQTDFDAVGERDGTVLLISCRAIRKGEEYFHGDWRAIRNARLRVEASVHQWIGKTNKLWECRIGDNFDLSKYSEMIAVVCTPTPLYVQDPPALQEVRPGLRRYTTAGELEEWLHFGNVIGKECGGSLRESFDTTMSEPRRPRRG